MCSSSPRCLIVFASTKSTRCVIGSSSNSTRISAISLACKCPPLARSRYPSSRGNSPSRVIRIKRPAAPSPAAPSRSTPSLQPVRRRTAIGRALFRNSSTFALTAHPCFSSPKHSPAPLPKKNKKSLAWQKIPDTFIGVLGGTTARCSIRCGGLYFFRGIAFRSPFLEFRIPKVLPCGLDSRFIFSSCSLGY